MRQLAVQVEVVHGPHRERHYKQEYEEFYDISIFHGNKYSKNKGF
jgi:hypothetical protein